jgi:hypothetical protein
MKYHYFKSVAKWAANKFKSPTNPFTQFCLNFREESKSHSHIYTGRDGPVYSWSFEYSNFKPAKQSTADILVFRYKKRKSQKKCDVRVIHKIQKQL